MEIQLHNTSKIVHINGVPARIWEGHTAKGVRILAFITRVAVPMAPEMGQAFDPRLVL